METNETNKLIILGIVIGVFFSLGGYFIQQDEYVLGFINNALAWIIFGNFLRLK